MNAAQDNYHEACCVVLDRALDAAPFYRTWKPRDPGPGAPMEQRFAALPITAKRDLRAHMPRGFVPHDRDLKLGLDAGAVEIVSTSGTTEDRTSIIWHQPWWDASEQAAAALHAGLAAVVRAAPREAVLTTPLCGGTVCHVGDLTMTERTLGRLLFLNQKPDPTRWTAGDMDRILSELNAFRPDLLEADPAYLAILCRHAARQGIAVHQPRFITLTYEFPSQIHLRQIRRAFAATPVLSSYGSTETGHVFTQCECGLVHQNTDTCHVEVQPLAGQPAGAPAVGRSLVTLLGHAGVALLRFDVGDLVRLADHPCACGRAAGLTLASIEGRTRDLTFAMNGQPVTVGALDRALADVDGVLAYRLEQSAPDESLCLCVAEPGFEDAAAAEAAETLRRVYGAGARITARRESVIAAEQSGKFRLAQARFAWQAETLFSS